MKNIAKKDKTDTSQIRLRCFCTEEEQCELCALKMTAEYEWWMLQDSYESELEAIETRKALKERELLLDLFGGLFGVAQVNELQSESEDQLYGY